MITSLLAATAVPTRGNPPPPEFTAFMVIWGLLGVSSFLFFHFNRNAALKRRIWPVFMVAVSVIFGGFVYLMMGRQQPQVLYFILPVIVLICVLNIRSMRFCEACGRTLYRQPIFAKPRFCSHCGAEL